MGGGLGGEIQRRAKETQGKRGRARQLGEVQREVEREAEALKPQRGMAGRREQGRAAGATTGQLPEGGDNDCVWPLSGDAIELEGRALMAM